MLTALTQIVLTVLIGIGGPVAIANPGVSSASDGTIIVNDGSIIVGP